jgi:hypothetical protein
METCRRLWSDEAGFIVSAELVLVSTILVIGMIVGLVSVRNQVVQELVDVGQAVGSLSQSYAYGGINKWWMAFTDGAYYVDKVDFCQAERQEPGFEPGGICIIANYPAGAPWCPPNGELGAHQGHY